MGNLLDRFLRWMDDLVYTDLAYRLTGETPPNKLVPGQKPPSSEGNAWERAGLLAVAVMAVSVWVFTQPQGFLPGVAFFLLALWLVWETWELFIVRNNPQGNMSEMEEERRNSQSGQGLAEYALMIALIIVLAIAAVVFFGPDKLNSMWNSFFGH